ncbi:hypothetical protein BY458DRAFT_531008 [Sporodiniella umbellata]|nr:hypothetical protein BY458DRAFT_531008 [Sporodiniella umbellata]
MSGPIHLPEERPNWIQRLFSNSDEHRPELEGRKKTTRAMVKVVLSLLLLGAMIGYWFYPTDSHPSIPDLTAREQTFLSLQNKSQLRDYLYHYTSEAHVAGTDSDKRQAEWTRDQLTQFGINTSIATYWPLLNYPISHRLALVSGPEHLRYEAKLTEDPVQEDPTSHDPNVVPTFHGYSKNGTAQGRVVYANYGRLEDFEFLKSQGIQLEGTIALVRYGGSFRGLKVRAAEVYGCAGVLIYSDPSDDGPWGKDAPSYPEGPWRSPSSTQRGSVLYLSLLSGDPLTPGYPALENATRLTSSPALPKIPSLPLSWEDALPLLKAMQGHGVRAGQGWTGGLPVDYFSGPTEGEAILVNHVENKTTPIWNVIGRIEGTEEPEKVILLGNHRDAWVYGAVDPSSGSAALLELGRNLGQLLAQGWRPKRTILLASWDAEEYGLVGSTEWVEENRDWLDQQAVVYINVDTAVSGPHFNAAASPSLNRLIYDVAAKVDDPRSGLSVYDAWCQDQALPAKTRPWVDRLGSGSDFVPFLDHVGIASMNLAFAGDYGVYHSNYDSFHWMEKFGDPEFKYHKTLVQIWGLVALRLADSPILPLSPVDYAAELSLYTQELEAYTANYTFHGLASSVSTLQAAAQKFEQRVARLSQRLSEYSTLEHVPQSILDSVKKVNDRLTYFERSLTDAKGIPGRTWFKHVVYAPGLWTGYSSQVFPAIIDGVDARNDAWVAHAEKRATESIQHAADSL